MSTTVPSADAKAVVKAVEGLSTQLRRVADALSTPVVRTEVAADDDATTPATTCSAQYHGHASGPRECIRAGQHYGDHIDEQGYHWSNTVAVYPVHDGPEREAPAADETAVCRRMETRTCPPTYNGPCGDRPCARFESDDPTPWEATPPAPGPVTVIGHWLPMTEQQRQEKQELAGMVGEFIDAQVQQAQAADEDAQRSTRRDSMNVLLSRAGRGVINRDEGALLRQHVEAEIREGDTARAVARSNLRHVRAIVPELEQAQARATQAEELLRVAHETSNRSEAERASAVRRAGIFETELRVLRAGLRANGADPTQIQNLWAQIRLRNRQWREAKREVRLTRSMLEEGGDVSLVDEMIATVAKAEGEARAERDRVHQLEAAIRSVLHLCGDQGSDVQDILRPALGQRPDAVKEYDILTAKVDEATATLRRVRAVTRSWEQQTLPHSQAHRLLAEVRDALAGPHPDDTEQPTTEE